MTPEQIKELALAGVRGETIKAINDELMTANAENGRLRAALVLISNGIDPSADQLQNWIAGQIDTVLHSSSQSQV